MLRPLRPLSFGSQLRRLNPVNLISEVAQYYNSVPYLRYSTTLQAHQRYISLYISHFLQDDVQLFDTINRTISDLESEVHDFIPPTNAHNLRLSIARFLLDTSDRESYIVSASGTSIPTAIYDALSYYFNEYSTILPSIEGVVWVPTFIDILYGNTFSRFSSYLWHFDNVRPGHIKCLVSLSPSLNPFGISCLNNKASDTLKSRFPFLSYPRFNFDLTHYSPICYPLNVGRALVFNTHNLHRDEVVSSSSVPPRCWASTQYVAVHSQSSLLPSLRKHHANCHFLAEGLTLNYLSSIR